jgi:flagellar assembly protein FliH
MLLDFDDFDAPAVVVEAPAPPPEPEVILPTQLAEDLAAAKIEAYDQGYQQGLADAAERHAATTAATMQAIEQGLRGATEAALQAVEVTAEAMTRLLVSLIGAGYPKLGERYGQEEIRQFVAIVVPPLRHETKVVVHVSPSMVEGVTNDMTALIEEFEDRLSVVGKASLPPGDARIYWKDGRAVRDSTEVWSAIREILEPLGMLAETEPAAQAAESESNDGK